ncbi:MAG: HesA/MoeB/ThiF family protein [Paracoccus sp. (in: a-proteobacteria)]|nr:HesA/MoeB/ThiF family protein [Paracoccus sp. (in: a-proteobacteria)]
MTRYARQIALPEIGAAGQARLGRSRVLVVGAGGLAAGVLPLLAGAGIGRLRIADHDHVALSNLHRQTLFRMTDLGRPKAEAAAAALDGLNPDCVISALVARLDPACAPAEIAQADLILDAADNFAISYALSDLCMAARKPLISASALGRAGYVAGLCASAPGLRALFPDLPARMARCDEGGVMGPAVAVMGALQAQMALSVLLGLAPSPLGLCLSVDLAGWRVSSFRFDAAPEPDDPRPAVIAPADIRPGDRVIELRAHDEFPAPPVQQARPDIAHLPPDPGRRTVFVCASGLRAWRAARALAARGPGEIAIIAAGT